MQSALAPLATTNFFQISYISVQNNKKTVVYHSECTPCLNKDSVIIFSVKGRLQHLLQKGEVAELRGGCGVVICFLVFFRYVAILC